MQLKSELKSEVLTSALERAQCSASQESGPMIG